MDSYNEVEDDHIKICEVEGSDFMEFPREENDTVLLSTIQAQFPNAIGLKYRGSSGAWRALRAVENVLDAPKGGWGDKVYCLTISETSKRKSEHAASESTKRSRLNPLLQDMAVMNLPFQTTEEELREYFEKHYGDLEYCEVKKFRDTGKSRGYGFIRFKDEVAAKEAVNGEHHMHGRRVDVKQKQDKPMKLFVGRLPDGTTLEELREYFGEFGELQDVYIPTPFRNFGFVTYASSEDGKNVLRDSHALHGNRLNVMERNQDGGKQGNKPPPNDRSRSDSTYDKYKSNESSSNYSYDRHNKDSTNYVYNKSSTSHNTYGASGQSDSNYSYDKYSSASQNVPSTQQSGGGMDSDLKNMLLQYLAGK